MYLLDTNVVSEIRKVNSGKANAGVSTWSSKTPQVLMHISVISLMEIEQGILQLQRRDNAQAYLLTEWFEHTVLPAFVGRIISIDQTVARYCASLHVPDKRPANDALLAATALTHNLTLVTRNIKDFAHMRVKLFNPFS